MQAWRPRSAGRRRNEVEYSCDSIRGMTGDGTNDSDGICLLRLRGCGQWCTRLEEAVVLEMEKTK
ncbi:hypothetical protein PENARI_c006G03180 [Penicillium arizonense]|uniref:Uncharacterized protein n=1 Tax=Penicillium arizonense TaxID=1835702 RepID=A0A1F5LLP5_PENAI|nr:hypothetical protein PENARI_c006G03180 [Penicillium arizonense]OGE54152.1 hypothetical protein PENARI_c006G03180 [Penicillium arizonense]